MKDSWGGALLVNELRATYHKLQSLLLVLDITPKWCHIKMGEPVCYLQPAIKHLPSQLSYFLRVSRSRHCALVAWLVCIPS